MEEDWEMVKIRAMECRLRSLRIRLMDLADNLAELTTEQLDIHSGAIIEDLRSLSYGSMLEGKDRLDEDQFQWRVGEIRELMEFSVDQELKNIEKDKHRKPRCTSEKRSAMLRDLRIDIPFTEMCFVPYDPYDFFMNLGKNLKDLVADELRDRAHDHAAASPESVEEEQCVSIHLDEETTTNDVFEQESKDRVTTPRTEGVSRRLYLNCYCAY